MKMIVDMPLQISDPEMMVLWITSWISTLGLYLCYLYAAIGTVFVIFGVERLDSFVVVGVSLTAARIINSGLILIPSIVSALVVVLGTGDLLSYILNTANDSSSGKKSEEAVYPASNRPNPGRLTDVPALDQGEFSEVAKAYYDGSQNVAEEFFLKEYGRKPNFFEQVAIGWASNSVETTGFPWGAGPYIAAFEVFCDVLGREAESFEEQYVVNVVSAALDDPRLNDDSAIERFLRREFMEYASEIYSE